MRVSVIIPTADRPAELRRALRSVYAQHRPPDEVIVVNDGAHDVDAPGARVVRTGLRSGAAIARNLGAELAASEWLAFLDDDDEWAPEYLDEAAHQAAEADVVLTAFLKVGRGGLTSPEKVPPPGLDIRELLVRNQGLRGSNLFIRRSVLREIGGFDEALPCAQDLDLAVRLADHGVRYRRNIQPRVHFHAHAGPRLSSPTPRNAFGFRSYLARHGARMTPDQMGAFRVRTRELFGSDPGPVPRLVWVVGPPGAGKTTWAGRLAAREQARVLELADMLEWRDGASAGVGRAKRMLAEAIRSVELQRPSGDRRLFVVSAHLFPEALGRLREQEHLIALVPSRATWRQRVATREGAAPLEHDAYDPWASRFGVGSEAAFAADAETR